MKHASPARRTALAAALFVLSTTFSAACLPGSETGDDIDAGPDPDIGPAVALFELPRPDAPPPSGFYALPFPNDIRVDDATGLTDMSDYIRPNPLIDTYINTIAATTFGFSVTAASFVRFDALIDPATLPADPDASRAEGASVYLVNIDPDSPNLGERFPLSLRFERYAGETIGEHWLAILPHPGFVLDEQTTYATVVTTRVLATDGTPVGRSDEFIAVMNGDAGDPVVTRARNIYQPLLDWLDMPGGDERDDVAVAAVFTTQDATSLMGDIREVIWDQLPAPVASEIVEAGTNAEFYWYDGSYDAPCFQQGVLPFTNIEDGGDIVVDPDTGLPIIQRVEPLRFSFTIPKNHPQPANGWPVVLFAHGTGGSYHSFVNSGVAELLAQQGIAMISIDQVMHEPRIPPGASPELLFFNFQNPLAARDNTLQGAADNFQLLRLALGFQGDLPGGPAGVTFDADKVYFFGHSQGGLTGPPFLAHEPLVKGAVLSGAGGLLYLSLILKTEPVDIASIVASFIRDYPLDRYNPVLAMLQMYIDRADPVVYGRYLVREPRPGITPKHIFQSEGFTDRYTPLPSIEALATSIGVDQVGPIIEDVECLLLEGYSPLQTPVSGNRNGVTAVLTQYEESAGSDGHFVVFNVPEAELQSTQFLSTLVETGMATLVTP